MKKYQEWNKWSQYKKFIRSVSKHTQNPIRKWTNTRTKAELAVKEPFEMGAEYYGQWKSWQYAVDTLKEEINLIK